MPVDASIPLSVQTPQLDYAQILGNALQLKQMQQTMAADNTLKRMLAEPGAIDKDTGLPTTNTLARYTSMFPQQGLALTEKLSTAQEHKAQIEHLQAETTKAQQESDTEFVSGAIGGYDAALSDGHTDPKIALDQLRTSIHDHIYSRPYSKERNDADWARASQASPEQLRAASMTAQQRLEAGRVTPYTDPSGHTVFVGQERGPGGAVEVTDQSGKPTELTGAIGRASGGGAPKFFSDPEGNVISDRNGVITNETTGEKLATIPKGSTTLTSGAARSAPAMAMQTYMHSPQYQTIPDDQKPAAIAAFNAGFHNVQLGGTASTKADTSSLTNITKIADASEAFEHTAMANFQNALKLAPKGIKTNMGPLVERWVQDPSKALGDPNVPAYQAALLTAANEYAKVIAGSTGSQGSTVDSRREAAEMFSSLYSTDQIENVINVAKQDMDNKIASYAGQREGIRDRIASETGVTAGGAAAPGAAVQAPGAPPGAAYHSAQDVVDAYHKHTLSRDAAAKILRDNGWAR